MKYLLYLLLVTTTISVKAAPFLVCDPVAPVAGQQSLNVVSYVVTGLGANPITSAAQVNADGSQQLHLDLATTPNGSYTVQAAAVNGLGLEGPFSVPFTFTVGLPAAPTGLRISPT